MELGDNYFTITPMTQRLEALEPGKVYNGSIKIINPIGASGDFRYEVSAEPYSVTGSDYEVNLLDKNDYTKIADWIKIDQPKGVVKPNETKEITFKISVPSDAPAGGQYAALVVSKDLGSNESGGSAVMVKDFYEMTSLIYADVKGETIHEGEVLENSVPGFVVDPHITLGARIDNRGNVHELASVVVEAKNVFTGEVIVDTADAKNIYTELIMPETERYVRRNIDKNLPALGVVHVSQTIYYNGASSKEERDVIICPIWFLILVICLVMALIAAIAVIVRRNLKKKQ